MQSIPITGGSVSANDPLALQTIITSECAPHLKAAVCSDRENLDILRKWLGTNKTHPRTLVDMAKAKAGCDSEACLYKKVSGMDKSALDTRFITPGPWNNTKWLSNKDIDDVLEQYTQKFPGFRHIEFQMRDFEKQGGELARVDWADAAKKYDSLACALNTDWSSGSGEHWTSFYVDFRNGTVEYFDSAGQTPLPEFSNFAVKVAHELSKATGRKFRDVMVTKVEHQKENTECGVYTLYYILSRLHGVKAGAFEYRRVDDNLMISFRKTIFRND